MLIGNWSSNGDVVASAGVVWSLRRWLTAIRVEAQGNGGLHTNLARLHQGVLLLNAEPRVQGTVHVHSLGTLGACVVLGRLVIPCIPGISKDHDVRVATLVQKISKPPSAGTGRSESQISLKPDQMNTRNKHDA